MNYLERITQEVEKKEKKAKEFQAKNAALKAEADLLAVEQQVEEKREELEDARSSEADFSLSRIAELRIEVEDLYTFSN